MQISGQEIFDLAIQVVVAAIYGAVAWTISTRKVSKKAKVPNMAFSLWWWGLVVLTGAGALWTIGGWMREPSLPLFITYVNFVLLVIMAAFAGMMYYFLYLWSGRSRLWIPIGLFFLALHLFLVYYIELQEPIGFDAEGTIEYANDLSESAFATFIGVFWLMPPLIGSFLHLLLIRKVPDPFLKFRIGVVASSIFVWFLVSLGSSLGNVSQSVTWWTYVSNAIAAGAALLTLMAYKPPTWVRRRFQLEDAPE